MDDQYGGDDDSALGNEPRYKYAKHSNAYMLVYVRASDFDRVLCATGEQQLAPELLQRFKHETDEKVRLCASR